MNQYTPINLDSLSPQQVLVEENFVNLKQEAYQLMDALAWDDALNLAKKLEIKFKAFKPANDSEQYWYGILRYWILRLKLFCYADMNSLERHEIIQNHVLEITRNGIDVISFVFRYIDLFNSPEIIKEETNSLITSLRNNQEILGKNITGFKQYNFFPNIGNWLGQYLISISQRRLGNINPGAFELNDFINSSQLVRVLSATEKTELKAVLSFYNWLISPIAFADIADPVLAPDKEEDESSLITKPQKIIAPAVKPAVRLQPIPHADGFRMTPQEIKREVGTVELPAPRTEELLVAPLPTKPPVPEKPLDLSDVGHLKTVSLQPPVKPVVQPIVPVAKPTAPEIRPSPSGKGAWGKSQEALAAQAAKLSKPHPVVSGPVKLSELQTIDDLKKISLDHMRGGIPSTQVLAIKSKIMSLAAANHVLPYYAVAAFEQSPLFQAYLQVGNVVMNDTTTDRVSAFKAAVASSGSSLTLGEFEAIADLRKEIEKM